MLYHSKHLQTHELHCPLTNGAPSSTWSPEQLHWKRVLPMMHTYFVFSLPEGSHELHISSSKYVVDFEDSLTYRRPQVEAHCYP